MKLSKNKKILLTTFFMTFMLGMIWLPKVSAVSRLEYCQSLARSSGSADAGERNYQSCIQKLNEEAWTECIVKPENQRGSCAEAYKNGQADQSSSYSDLGLDNAPERPKSCDGREDLSTCLSAEKNPIIFLIQVLINTLAIGVAVTATIMIIVGGIQYSSAGSNPQAVQAAKTKITNAVIAVIAYVFLYAFLQWLIPGGLF